MEDFFGFLVLPENVPMGRPGVYRVTHRSSGRAYIGMSRNVELRCRQHAAPKDQGKFSRAVRKYGPGQFLIEPLFYVLAMDFDRRWLAAIETALIAEHDSIRCGYNIKAADAGVGPYGSAFSERMRKAHAQKSPDQRGAHMRPAVEASVAARREWPVERRKATIQAALAALTPEHHLRAAQRVNAGQTPEVRRGAALKRLRRSTPEQRSRIARKRAATLTAEQHREIALKRNAHMSAEVRSDGARKRGAKLTSEQRRANTDAGRAHLATLTRAQLAEFGRKGAAALTPEQRSAMARKRAAGMSPDRRSEIARKGVEERRRQRALKQLTLELPTLAGSTD